MVLISDSWKLEILTVLLGVITGIIFFLKRKYTYWQRKGFDYHPEISYIFGNLKQLFLQREHLVESIERIYQSTTVPFVGFYTILRPTLLIRDPELIRSLLIKDFNNFTDRGIHCDEENDPISANLLSLPGAKWKNLRGKLTPTFSSGKLKAMFSTLVNCGSTLQN